MESLLGANWRTTLTGIATAISGLVAFLSLAGNDLNGLIPPQYSANVALVSGILAAVLHGINGVLSKDAVISGNGTVDNPQVKPTSDGLRSQIVGLLALGALLSFTGCAWIQAHQSQIKAVGTVAAVDSVEVLGQAAVQTLWNVAKSEADNGSADWQSAATSGLFANLNYATGAKVVSDIINAYSANKAPNTAAAAQVAFAAADSSQNKSAVVAAIANTINSAVQASAAETNNP